MKSSLISNKSSEGEDIAKLERNVLGKKDSNVSGKDIIAEYKPGSAVKSRSRSYNDSCMLKSGNKSKTYKLYSSSQ
jgi:hypothetical protein